MPKVIREKERKRGRKRKGEKREREKERERCYQRKNFRQKYYINTQKYNNNAEDEEKKVTIYF